ncbi:MAG: 1-(5-phosphoribosyl)-5-[(5-phosphoribosylamino)methylideneamino]imidazole-4-carboxamide isomerase [Gemmatimonadota bacterium]
MTETHGQTVTLFPAIDLRRGRCVRLEQGAPDRETVYESDPFRMAETFVGQGAEWIHVVDLDAAFDEGSNRALINELARVTPAKIQTGGGLRSEADLAEVLDGDIGRAVIGTAAIERPELVGTAVTRWGADRIAVGLDARGLRPAVRGWQEETEADLFEVAAALVAQGARTILYTDIARDGMFTGPNIATSLELAERVGADVVISGGVGGMDDIDAVRDAGRRSPRIVGVIVGKAIYEGRVSVADALRRLGG